MEHDLATRVSLLVLQLAVILLAAKLGAEIAERWLRQPPVLGELAAGMLVGPYALGGVPLPLLGPLFPLPATGVGPGQLPVSTELYALGQVAAVVLLFVAGLETDFGQFLRFGPAAGAVATGGVVLPFVLGAGATVALGLAASLLEPAALFMGAVLTATSVGITARVLADLGKLDTPEGVTILAAAVIDDVLGILVLAMVVGLATAGTVAPAELGLVGLRALVFWLLLVAVAVAAAEPLARLFARFQGEGALVPLVLAIGFLGAAVAQAAGLALIIGAYSVGLAFSRVRTAAALRRVLRPVYHLLVPIFFVVIGMLVDLPAMSTVLLFGTVITLLAILGKVVGCGAIALAVGFNRLGALRVGLGMLPRGEVALIIAGVG
ncbi:MAG TPA: cation:proton antiporter, partial [Chloroflexota bacterium]|nr:cation:proton antiporter [Chloroflexota bacterium]